MSAPDLPDAVPVDHWYFLGGVDVGAPPTAGAVVILGDSITDGRGSTTNGNDRWPDVLARRLQASPATAGVAVLNAGIGGNRLLRDGLGPNVLARFDRDVLAQPGVRWLIVLEGINDIGTAAGRAGEGRACGDGGGHHRGLRADHRTRPRTRHPGLRGHDHAVRGVSYAGYFSPESEADRQKVNAWIRTSGRFDAVIDFDAIARDPEPPVAPLGRRRRRRPPASVGRRLPHHGRSGRSQAVHDADPGATRRRAASQTAGPRLSTTSRP